MSFYDRLIDATAPDRAAFLDLALIRTATRMLWRAAKAQGRARAEAWSAKLGLAETASASAVPHRSANNG